MILRTLGALGIIALATSSVSAAGETKSMRTLTFKVAYSLVSTTLARNSGLGNAALMEHPATRPHGFEQHGFAGDETGTVSVDVIAATADRGLVVDARYDGKTRQLPIRVAIFEDGRLTYDPKQTLVPQVVELLPLLARGLLREHGDDPGSSWTTSVPEPATGTRSYRVTSATTDVSVISVSADLAVKGPQGYEEHQDGRLTYRRDLSTPLAWETWIRFRRSSVTGSEFSDVHLTASLASDTFAKTPR